MTTVVFEGPQAPQGKHLCTPCILLYKAAIVSVVGQEIKELEEDGLDAEKVLRMKDYEVQAKASRPRVSVGVAHVNGNPQLGPVPVCWEHMMVVITNTPSGLAAVQGNVDTALGMLGLAGARPGQRS